MNKKLSQKINIFFTICIAILCLFDVIGNPPKAKADYKCGGNWCLSFWASTNGPVDPGTPVTLSWAAQGAIGWIWADWYPGSAPDWRTLPRSGSYVVYPQSTQTYVLKTKDFWDEVWLYVTVSVNQKTLVGLTILPQNSAPLIFGQTQQFNSTAHYSDNSTKPVTTTSNWSTAANIGSVDNKGLFSAANVSSQQSNSVYASYTEPGTTTTFNAATWVTVNPVQSFNISVKPQTGMPDPMSPGIPKGQAIKYDVKVASVGGFQGNANLSMDPTVFYADSTGSRKPIPSEFFEIKFGNNLNSGVVSVPSNGTGTTILSITPLDPADTTANVYNFMVKGTNDGATMTHWSSWFYLKVIASLASNISVTGDIYSGLNIGNLSIGAKSVLAAQTITPVDSSSYWKISPYTYTLLGLMQDKMNNNIKRLKSEDAKTYSGYNISGYFNLNPIHGSPTDLDFASRPEGQVWVHSGDLTIDATGATFFGKGTIIVDNGNIYINGDIKYGADSTGNNPTSLGIIANGGNIVIANGVSQVQGAFYTSGSINIQ
ncbi:MAG: hypothetical protein WC589_20645 [Sphingobacterium sp.]